MLPDLKELGPRIAIIGPSNAGKSTLAVYLAGQLEIPCYHLDQIAHVPGTAYERRPNEELIRDHDQIITQDSWIVEGNYSICMDQRFSRATSVIWPDPPLMGCIFRYIKRSIKKDPNRPGGLGKEAKEFNLHLIKFILFNYPKNKEKYKEILKRFPDLKVFIYNEMLSLD